MNAPSIAASGTIAFRLNGSDVSALPGETLIEVADRLGVPIPRLCYKPGMRADGNCRSCMVEIKGERVLAPSCCRAPAAGMEVTTDSARAVHAQKMIVEMLVSDVPATVYKPDSELEQWRRALGDRHAALRAARAARRRPLASGDGGQPRRVHPVHALRARVPRGAGQRRHRLRAPRRALGDRVRPRRPDGRVDVRRLRRMRAGVPDGRARAGAQRVPRAGRPAGGVGLPVLRRGLPAHVPRAREHDRARRRARRPRQPRAPVREGALRLRLRRASAPADEAADPPRRTCRSRPTSRWTPRIRSRCSARRRGTRRWRARPARSCASATRTGPGRSPASARPRAATRRRTCSRSSCARASAPTTSTTARGCATRRASRRCSRASARARCRTR